MGFAHFVKDALRDIQDKVNLSSIGMCLLNQMNGMRK